MSLGNYLGKTFSEQAETNQGLAHEGVIPPELLAPMEIVEPEEWNVVLEAWDINDSFVLGHPDNGVLGTSKLGDRRTSAGEILRRAWLFDTKEDLDNGTTQGSVNIENGNIMFG